MPRLLAALLMVLACACSAPQQQITLAGVGLAMELPAGWELQRAEGQTLLFARPVEQGAPVPSAYLQLVRHPQRPPAAGNLENYAAFSEQQAQQFALGYQRLESASVTVAGQPALRQLRRWKGYQREREELAYVWVSGGYGYQLSGVAEPTRFGDLRAAYERAATSLHASGG